MLLFNFFCGVPGIMRGWEVDLRVHDWQFIFVFKLYYLSKINLATGHKSDR